MQTKLEVLQKIDELIPELIGMVSIRAQYLLDDGVINFEDFENNYALPKILLSVIGEYIKSQYEPPSKNLKRIRNELLKV